MPAAPTLSIGMPVYNGAKWIRESIDYLLNQSFKDFELIIADNASTDETGTICRGIAERDPRVRYHRHSSNIGVFGNYNYVFELSTAPFFKWASCNDICLDGFLEKCLAVLHDRPDVVLAYPKAIVIFAPSGQEPYGEEYDDNLNLEQERPSDRFRDYLNREKINNVMNGVIRASALRETALNRQLPGSDISMINGVELVVLDELHQVRDLHRDRAVRRQQLFHSGHKVVEIGDVSQNVVADQEIGGPAPASEVHGDGSAEELDVRGDATGFGNLRHVGGRLDSQYVEAASHKVLEQVSVVRRNFHNPAVLAQAEALNRRVGICPRVGDPAV